MPEITSHPETSDIEAIVRSYFPPDSHLIPEIIRDDLWQEGIKVVLREPPTMIGRHPRNICGFQLVEQKNCCGVMVSTNTYVTYSERNRGLAQLMMPMKDAIAKLFGYSALCATVNESGNPTEVHILLKNGWTKTFGFLNKRTGNNVGFYCKSLDNNNNKQEEQQHAVPQLQRDFE